MIHGANCRSAAGIRCCPGRLSAWGNLSHPNRDVELTGIMLTRSCARRNHKATTIALDSEWRGEKISLFHGWGPDAGTYCPLGPTYHVYEPIQKEITKAWKREYHAAGRILFLNEANGLRAEVVLRPAATHQKPQPRPFFRGNSAIDSSSAV
jgi:hypothetical protein